MRTTDSRESRFTSHKLTRRLLVGSFLAALPAVRFAAWAQVIPLIADFKALRGLLSVNGETEAATLVMVDVTDAARGFRDQGGGLFRLDPADTSSPDNGGTVLVDQANRRWKRVTDSPEIYAAWFGADRNAADNAPHIAAAIAALPPDGGSVMLPDGRLTSSMITLRSNLELAGSSSDGCTLVYAEGQNGYGLFGSDIRNCKIRDLTFDGNSEGNAEAGMGIRLEGESTDNMVTQARFTNWRFDGVAFVDAGVRNQVVDCRLDGNKRDGASFTGTSWNRVSGCRIGGNGRFGIVFGAGTAYSTASDNHCDGNGHDQICAVNASNVSVTGNICCNGHDQSLGIQLNTVTRGVIADNQCYNNTISGLGCYMSTHVTVSGNVVYANKVRGIEIDSVSQQCTVTGNVAYQNVETGISVYRSPGAVLTGNFSTENGTGGEAPFGIRIWDNLDNFPSSNCILVGNVCTDARGDAATQTFGISIEASTTRGIVLQGNTLTPNREGAVSAVPGAISEADGNAGFVTRNVFSVTIPAGQTEVTAEHGLSLTPAARDVRIVQEAPSANPPGSIWVGAIDERSITVHCAADPGGDGLQLGVEVDLFG